MELVVLNDCKMIHNTQTNSQKAGSKKSSRGVQDERAGWWSGASLATVTKNNIMQLQKLMCLKDILTDG